MNDAPGTATPEERFAAEKDLVETSPAQPDEAGRIDDVSDADVPPGPAHVKHDHSGRMQH